MRHTPLPLAWLVVLVALGTSGSVPVALNAQTVGNYKPPSGFVPPESQLIPLGTTKGESYGRLVIQNAMVVSGRGSPRSNRSMPPEGPVDIIIEDGRIVDIILVDAVNLGGGSYERVTGDRVIDAQGMYVLPGLVEMHAHLPSEESMNGYGPEYAYRLYLGHGITTVRDAGTGAGLDFMTQQREASARNEFPAPRLVLCQRWPLPLRRWNVGNTPERAREQVRLFQEMGADCVKISRSPGQYPDVLEAAVSEANLLGMHVMVDLKVSESDALVASHAGVRSIEHWYGVPDAALPHTQNFPPDYNYWDELKRFRWAGELWSEAAKYPERLDAVLDTMVMNGTNWNPTMVVYEDFRDWGREMTMPWRETLIMPQILDKFGPDSTSHGSFKTEWKTSDEIRWRKNFGIWMDNVRSFHEKGGLLTAGSDAGPVGGLYLIRELEMMQEAGINPIDIIRIATTNAYRALGMDKDGYCGIRVGCRADLAVVDGNPIDNLKVMYGRGYGFYAIKPRDEQMNYGGVAYTIKDGIVFDAKALLQEVEWLVKREKERIGREATQQGGGG